MALSFSPSYARGPSSRLNLYDFSSPEPTRLRPHTYDNVIYVNVKQMVVRAALILTFRTQTRPVRPAACPLANKIIQLFLQTHHDAPKVKPIPWQHGNSSESIKLHIYERRQLHTNETDLYHDGVQQLTSARGVLEKLFLKRTNPIYYATVATACRRR